jgi:hypothetical protein
LEIGVVKVGLGFKVFTIQMWVPFIKGEGVGNLYIDMGLNKIKTHKDERISVWK